MIFTCQNSPNDICGSCVLSYLGLTSAITMLLCMGVGYVVLGRFYDSLLTHREGPDFDFWPSKVSKLFIRPLGYALFIVANINWEKLKNKGGLLDRIRKKPPTRKGNFMTRTYGDIDYRGIATPFQKAFSFVYVIAGYTFLVLAILLDLCNRFGA